MQEVRIDSAEPHGRVVEQLRDESTAFRTNVGHVLKSELMSRTDIDVANLSNIMLTEENMMLGELDQERSVVPNQELQEFFSFAGGGDTTCPQYGAGGPLNLLGASMRKDERNSSLNSMRDKQ